MTLTYDEIYELFLSKVTDYSILELIENGEIDLVKESMHDWLKSSLSIPQTKKLFTTSVLDNDKSEFQFQLKNSVDDNSDLEFVCNLLSDAMVIKWLSPRVNSTLNINQMYGGKEEKFYSQSNHTKQLCDMYKDLDRQYKKMIRDYGYINIAHTTGVE